MITQVSSSLSAPSRPATAAPPLLAPASSQVADHVQLSRGPARVASAPPQATAGRASLGLGTLAALSMLGLAGCVATTTPAFIHNASPVVFCGTADGHRCSVAADGRALQTLSDQNRLYQEKSSYDSDRFGKPLTRAEAETMLDSGKPIVVSIPALGPNQGAFVDNYDELQLLQNIETPSGFVGPLVKLPADVQYAAPALRHFEGHAGHDTPSIYSSQMKGGFFGIGQHPDRISAYQAYQELHAGRPVEVKDAGGQVHDLHNMTDLKNLVTGQQP